MVLVLFGFDFYHLVSNHKEKGTKLELEFAYNVKNNFKLYSISLEYMVNNN